VVSGVVWVYGVDFMALTLALKVDSFLWAFFVLFSTEFNVGIVKNE
jgi:hypothetical protein